MLNFFTNAFHALKNIQRNPFLFVVIIGIVALTVGANSLIFGLINGVLLSPLPYPEPESLVVVWEENIKQGYKNNTVSLPNFEDWRREAISFKALGAWKREEDIITGHGEPKRLVGAMVTSEYFAVLGVKPLLGRSFNTEEELKNANLVLIGEGLWRSNFEASRGILGQSVLLDGTPYTIIGVMPEDFEKPLSAFLNEAAFWRPMAVNPQRANRETRFLYVLGRVAGDPVAAETELTSVARRLEAQYPENKGWSVSVVPLHDEIVRAVRPVLRILWVAANLVLLVGCTNLANILLARAAGREQEIALRLSLGASRWRIFSLFAAEILVLVLPGSLLGALLAWMGGQFLTLNYLQFMPRLEEINLRGPVLRFTLLLAIAITLVTSLLVVMQSSKLNLGKRLVQGQRAGTSRSKKWVRDLLAVLQVVFTFPLLVSTLLLMKSMLQLENVDLGFNPESVIAGEVVLPDSRYGNPQAQRVFYQNLLERLQGAPGITASSAISDLPLSRWDTGLEFMPVGRQIGAGEKMPSAQFRVVAPEYFRTMAIRRTRGRDFDDRDRGDTEPVLIVSEELVRRFFRERDPLGEHLSVNYFGVPFEGRIIGVVGDVRHGGPTDELEPTIYAPYLKLPSRRMTILMRSNAGSEGAAATLRAEIRSLDSALPASDLVSLEELYDLAIAGPRLRSLVLGIFATVALALATLGIYGVVAYSTAIRRHEIGVRMALGAKPSEILLMILHHGVNLCLWGILGGALIELVASRFLANQLHGVDTMDIGVYAIVAVLLMLIGVVASLKPASGAVQISPTLLLKSE